MSKIIPVMVHHETGEKAQAAGEEEPGILKILYRSGKKI